MDEDTWIKDESHHAAADVGGSVGSDPGGSSDGFKSSPKLRARMEKLAKRRINPAKITLGNGSEYHGGHATVSKGTLKWNGFRRISRWSMRGHWQDVAVKKMRLADDTDFERVLGLTIREAEFLAKLNHPNIVELKGFVEDISQGIIWLVFPWAEYGNLKDFIAREKWDIPERISLISDVATGLEYLHTQNPPICHGDLKSLNVLIYDDSGGYGRWQWRKISARITDFGSARRLPQCDPDTQVEEMVTQLPSAQPPSAAFCASTKTVTLTGNKYTLRWAAPELLLQDQLSLWSDIWALGWICYEVMTGSLPFEDAPSEMAVVTRVLEGQLPSLTDNAHLSLIHELCSLMNMCWEVKPSQRPSADSCRRSIEKMPKFAPQIKDDQRVLDYHNLRQLGQMYQSRGEYARAFTFFVNSVTGRFQLEHRVQGLRDLAQLARLRKEYSETIAVYDVIWQIYEESNGKDTGGLADALYDLAELYRLRKQSEENEELHYEGQRLQARQRIASALRTMAENYRHEGSHGKAIQLKTNALEIGTDLGDRKGRDEALWGLANGYRRQSEYKKTIPLYSDVLEIRTGVGDREGTADALWGLAEVHRLRDEYDKAIPLYSEAFKISTDSWAREEKADDLWSVAEAHRLRDEYDKAIPLYSEVLKIPTEPWCPNEKADDLWTVAEAHRLRDEYDKAIPLYSEVLKIPTDPWSGDEKADDLWSVAEAHRLRGEYDKAMPLYKAVLKIPIDLWNRKRTAHALWGLAELHRLRREDEEAIPLYYKALGISTEIDDRKGKAAALLGLAGMDHDQGDVGGDLYQQVAEILEPSRTLTDPASDDERLVRLRIRVLNWLVRRLRSLASDLTKGLPAETASEAWVSVQEVHEDERPSKRFKQS